MWMVESESKPEVGEACLEDNIRNRLGQLELESTKTNQLLHI